MDILTVLQEHNCQVNVFDPWLTPKDAQHEYGIMPVELLESDIYDAIILAVTYGDHRGGCLWLYAGTVQHLMDVL